MLTRKNIKVPETIKQAKFNKLKALYKSFIADKSYIEYKDETLHMLYSILEEIINYPSNIIPPNKYDVALSDKVNMLFNNYKDYVKICYDSAQDIPTVFPNLANDLRTWVLDIKSFLNMLILKIGEIEVAGKTKRNNVSIHREEMHTTDFKIAKASSSTLIVDSNASALILPSTGSKTVIPSFISIIPDKKQMEVINKGDITEKEDDDVIKKGWYPGDFYNSIPKFGEVDNNNKHIQGFSDTILSYLYNEDENDLVEVEYVTNTTNDNLTVTISLNFDKPTDVDTVDINLAEKTIIQPYVNTVKIKTEDETKDITSRVFGAGFRLRGNTVLLDDKKIENNRRRFLIQAQDVLSITFELTTDEPEIFDAKYISLYTKNGSLIRDLNYLETLRFTGADTIVDNNIDQYDLTATDFEIYDVLDEYSSEIVINNRYVEKMRYALELNSIKINNCKYESSGYYESIWCYTKANIRTIEIYTDEYIPNGLSPDSIKWYVSMKENEWTEVVPINRPIKLDKPYRVKSPEEKELEGTIIEQGSDKQRYKVKIVLKGNNEVTPFVNNYAVRIKT